MVSSLTWLAGRKARQYLVLRLTLLHGRNAGQRRPLMQPGTQRVQRLSRAASKYLNVAIIQVNRTAGDAELLRLPACAVPKPDALHAPTNPDQPGLTAGTAGICRYAPSSSAASDEDSVALRASSALIFACFASRLACEYWRSLSLFSAF